VQGRFKARNHHKQVCIHRTKINGINFLWPPVWSSGQSSWLQIQRYGLDSRHYQIFWEVVGLERGPLSLLSTIEELLGRKSSGSGLESREYGHRDPLHWPRGSLYSQKVSLTSPTIGGHSVGIVLSRTQATEFSFNFLWMDDFLFLGRYQDYDTVGYDNM
jgi:hypothetical protein